MKKYYRINNITGWCVFAFASVVYLLTIEPTNSFWDCGEFISSAFKLEVGHPPGAPLWMIMARVFSLFSFGDNLSVARSVNSMSALVSGFTILFLFWTITHIARKLIVLSIKNKTGTTEVDFSIPQLVTIMGAGIVGALVYTFSDTFWFSAVEAEVYATSSLFTAIVFWAILKWEDAADKPYANRWIILIAYLMGLSIGVHLLNLLAIPAIVFVYYFKKYSPTGLRTLFASLIAIIIIGIIQYGIIPGVVAMASNFELLFVNGFGLPYLSGILVYVLLLLALIVGGLYFTYKYKKPILNTIVLAFTVIIIGYSSFAMIVIRSLANPPMDENNPENVFSLLAYLNREQYGNRPLLYGQYFNAPASSPDDDEGKPVYTPKDGKYVVTDRKSEYIYNADYQGFMPRMYSRQDSHIKGYLSWTGTDESDYFNPYLDKNGQPRGNASGEIIYNHNDPKKRPSFFTNLEFLIKYQIGHMYIRYFMWNFAGRQNNEQGMGGYFKGNWISGIPFIDSIRLGSQDNLPETMKSNKGRNRYFFLPLILGFFGLFYLLKHNNKDFWIVLLLFFFTGIAIILYTNQTPYQPRERDYAYAGSFYAFAIWIGIGVMAVYNWLKNKFSSKISAYSSVLITLIAVPVLMGFQNWDDHDRSGRYTARDFARNYLESCAPNAILFTYGDNDTFPLWYVQEVEGFRTDVRVVNLSLLATDWYIDQMQRKAYDSEPVPFSMTYDQYIQGVRDFIMLYDSPQLLAEEKYQANFSEFRAMQEALYHETMQILDNSKFPELQSSDYKTLSRGYNAISPLQLAGLISALSNDNNIQKFNVNKNGIEELKEKSENYIYEITNSPLPVKAAIEFVKSDDESTKIGESRQMDFIPSKKLMIPVDSAKVIENGTVSAKNADKILSEVVWTVPKRYLGKSEMLILDLLANNNWERPVYFATSIGSENFLGLQSYFQLEGLAYRLVPIKTSNPGGETGCIDTDIMYDNVMNKFTFGRMEEPDVFVDEQNIRTIGIMNLRGVFSRLAEALTAVGKKDSAIIVLNTCMKLMPHEKVPFDTRMIGIIEAYYEAGAIKKANAITLQLADIYTEELKYYNSLNVFFQSVADYEKRVALFILHDLSRITEKYKQKELTDKIEKRFINFMPKNE